MGKSGIKINLKGFDKMLENIKEAGGDVDNAAKRAIKASANLTKNELISEARAKGVPTDITDEATWIIDNQAPDRYTARVGWDLSGGYNPKEPSAGYKAIFLNYGTPRRTTRKGYNRGEVKGRQFIRSAKKKARPKVKEALQKIMERVMRDLEK